MMRWTLIVVATAAILAVAYQLRSSDSVADEPQDQRTFSELYRGMETAMRQGERDTAVELGEALLKKAGKNDSVAAVRVAHVFLRSGQPERSVPLFDRYVEEQPHELARMWPRGIALYFAGEYQRGAEQFEVHRTVNPNDVENAAWHFVCVAKARSFDEAGKLVLPAPNDVRLPMTEVHEMLTTGDTKLVSDAIDAVPVDSSRRQEAEFYGYFYLGLYADARGDQKQALSYMKKSAAAAPAGYMGDIAHVYVDYLSQ